MVLEAVIAEGSEAFTKRGGVGATGWRKLTGSSGWDRCSSRGIDRSGEFRKVDSMFFQVATSCGQGVASSAPPL